MLKMFCLTLIGLKPYKQKKKEENKVFLKVPSAKSWVLTYAYRSRKLEKENMEIDVEKSKS